MAKTVRTLEEEAAFKAMQSRVGRSNVRRSKSHERRVAALFTAWTGAEFRRRRVEGRDATVIERESTADVIPVRGDICFSIEAKCGVVASLDNLLASPAKGPFTEWWHQATYDAQLVSKVLQRVCYPLLMFKPHANFDWVAIDQTPFRLGVLKPAAGVLEKYEAAKAAKCEVWFPHIAFDAYLTCGPISCNVTRTRNKKNFTYVPLQLPPLYMMRWKDLAANVDPASIFLDGVIPTAPITVDATVEPEQLGLQN